MLCNFCSRHNNHLVKSWARSCRRYLGTVTTKLEDPKPEPPTPMALTNMKPIKSLGIKDELDKLPMQQSFVSHMFLGVCDGQFLNFPKIMKTRQELDTLNEQKQLVDKYFANISCDDPDKLNDYGFNDLWTMSMSEQVAYYEAIGASCYKDHRGEAIIEKADKHMKRPLNLLQDDPTLSLDHFTNTVKLIVRNNLVWPLFNCTTNEVMSEKISKLMQTKPHTKIAYAYTESHESSGTAMADDWFSEARLSRDGKDWIISLNKNFIIDDNYDQYLVICKTKDYQEVIDYKELKRNKPYGMVALLIDKIMIPEISKRSSNNIDYQNIRVQEVTLPRSECEVISPTQYGQRILTCKAMGQLAVASIILGKVKCSLDSCIHHLTTFQPNRLKNSEFLQWIYFQARNKVLAMETIIYMTAGIMDSFDEASELHLEAIICKNVATNFGHDALKMVQMLYGSNDKLITATQEDQINLWNGFLEGTYYNTLLVGLTGLRTYGMYQHEKIHKLKLPVFYPAFKYRHIFDDWRKYDNDWSKKGTLNLSKYFVVNYEERSFQVEKCIEKLEFASQLLMIRYVKEVSSHQVDVSRMGEMAALLYISLSLMSRATMHATDFLYGYSDVARSTFLITEQCFRDFEYRYQKAATGPHACGDKIFSHVHSRNMKFGGYFAFSPLDRNVY